MRDERRTTLAVSLADAVKGGSPAQRRARARDGNRLAKDDLLKVAISLVKSEEPHSEPAEFVSDVACTFEALSAETQDPDSREQGMSVAVPCAASRLDITNSFEPGLGWLKAS